MVYAGFWRRLAAHIIDIAVVGLVMWIVLIPLLLVGGVALGGSLLSSMTHKESSLSTPHDERRLVQKMVPLNNDITLAQTAAPSEQQLPYTTPTPEATEPTESVEPVEADMAVPHPAEHAATSEDSIASDENSDDTKKDAADLAGTLTGIFANIVVSILAWGFGIAYHTYFVGSKWQATPGKRVMQCCVVSRDGKPLDYGHAFARHIACFLSWLPFPPLCIGFYLAGWNGEKKALHDMIAGTRVVRTKAELPVLLTR